MACLSDFFPLRLLRLPSIFSLVLHASVIFPMVFVYRYLSPSILYNTPAAVHARSSIVPPFSSAAVFPSVVMYIILFARETAVRKPQLCIHDNDDVIIQNTPSCTPRLDSNSVLSNFAPGVRVYGRLSAKRSRNPSSAVPSRDYNNSYGLQQ